MAEKISAVPLESAAYACGIVAYGAGVRIAAMRNAKAAKLIAGHKETWRKLEALATGDRYIWFHAASLGEFEQARPVIEAIRKRMPGKKILLSFFSPSGYEVRKNYPLADVVCYLPFDTARNARRFIKAVNPEMAIFVKYEIWRNYLLELNRRDVPTYLISAAFRPNQAFFRPLTRSYGRWLRLFSHIFVQDELSVKLLSSIGIDSTIAGDTRFDRVADIRSAAKPLPELERFAVRKPGEHLLVVGSSWQPDEDAYIPWLLGNPSVKAIIAPHEFDDARIKALLHRLGPSATAYSALKDEDSPAENLRYIVVDCFGLLSSIYRFANAAVVGGGLGVGIHNINEAAVYAIPVMFGPNYHRFVEAEELIDAGGALSYKTTADFAPLADSLFGDERQLKQRGRIAGEYIASKLGATGRVLSAIFPEDFRDSKS